MAKTTTKTAKKSGDGSNARVFEAQVAKAMTSAYALRSALQALGLTVLTDDERTHTLGKLRAGEAEAITCVFDTVDSHPVFFESLAERDGGSDPAAIETPPARDGLARAEALAPLLDLVAQMQTIVSDGIFASADFAKELSVPAYAIGKALSATNAKLRASLAPAISFYGAPGKKLAAKNARAAAKRAAINAKTAN